MRSSPASALPIGILLALAPASAPQAVTRDPTTAALEIPLPYNVTDVDHRAEKIVLRDAAAERSRDTWVVHRDPRTQLVHFAYGGGFSLAPRVANEDEAAELPARI
jgi:hypothetical protein